MATRRKSIFGIGTIPDDSGNVFFERYDVTDTAAAWKGLVLAFKDSGTKAGVRGSFEVPQDYVGSAKIVIVWTANETSGTCVFDWSVLPRSGVEDMGAAFARTTETDSTTKGGTAFTRETNDITLTDADYAKGDEVLYELFRDSITDTMAAKCLVFNAYFEYADA